MKRFQDEAAKLREELKVAITQLPTSKEIPSLLSNISQLGKDSGLEFLLFKPVGEINKDFYAEIPVEIRVKGAYNNVAIFFDKVGKLPRIVNISEVSMDNAKEVLRPVGDQHLLYRDHLQICRSGSIRTCKG